MPGSGWLPNLRLDARTGLSSGGARQHDPAPPTSHPRTFPSPILKPEPFPTEQRLTPATVLKHPAVIIFIG